MPINGLMPISVIDGNLRLLFIPSLRLGSSHLSFQLSTMGITAENARIPPFARHDGAFSGSRLEEDVELLERNSTTKSTTVTTPLLATETRSVVPAPPSMAGMKWKARLQMASLCWTMFERYQMKRGAAGVEWLTRAKSSWAEAEMVGMAGGESIKNGEKT
jgi:hypothetical protein